MEVNPSKSLSICATTVAGKSVVRTRPIFKVQGQFLPALGHLNTFRYLGLQFGSTGTAKPTLFHLRSWLSNLERFPLKPHQKLHMLKIFVIPRLYHGLQAPTTTGGLLVECDRLVRRTAKKPHYHRWASRRVRPPCSKNRQEDLTLIHPHRFSVPPCCSSRRGSGPSAAAPRHSFNLERTNFVAQQLRRSDPENDIYSGSGCLLLPPPWPEEATPTPTGENRCRPDPLARGFKTSPKIPLAELGCGIYPKDGPDETLLRRCISARMDRTRLHQGGASPHCQFSDQGPAHRPSRPEEVSRGV
ncbi:hypothetical protein QE152_g30548 [Popillia japonica]|uniref:Uncharacterized protein n=1 Tax=Popillia japonica TaxID=7064 RepID=A0AAW1JEA9_POPJA